MTKELLKKFLEDKCSREELEEVISWAKSELLNRESRKLILDDWSSYTEGDSSVNTEKLSYMLDKIHHRINVSEEAQIYRRRLAGSSVFLTWLTRAAAIFLIPVLSVLIYTLSDNSIKSKDYSQAMIDTLEVVTPVGSRTVFELSDGSVVHLNAGSRLRYPRQFASDTREVELDGEGFFDVTPNSDMPFVVNAGKLRVKALGTEFNVMAYPEEDAIEATLVEGKVLLEEVLSVGATQSLGIMKQNQFAAYNRKTGKVLCYAGNIEKYTAWTEGRVVFKNDPMTRVVNRLNRMFNVDITLDKEIKDYTLTVTFIDEPLFQILELMTVATPLNYRALPRKKLPDGTFSKQEIIITKR